MLVHDLFESSPSATGQNTLKQLQNIAASGQDGNLTIGVDMMPIQSWQATYLMSIYKALNQRYGVDKALSMIGNYDFVDHALERQEQKLSTMSRVGSVPGERGVAEVAPVTIGSKLPKSDTETFGLEGGRPYKINNPKDWKPGDRPRAIQQLIPTQDKKDHIRSRLGKHAAPVLPERGVAEGYYDLGQGNVPGMTPIDFDTKPSFKEIIDRYTQLVYQGHAGETSPEEDQEYDAIEQYVAKRFGDKGSAHLQKAGEVSYWGRDDGRGSGGSRSSNLGRPNQPSGDFRTTKAGKMHGQDVKAMKSKVAGRLGQHPAPELPEGVAEVAPVTIGLEAGKKKDTNDLKDQNGSVPQRLQQLQKVNAELETKLAGMTGRRDQKSVGSRDSTTATEESSKSSHREADYGADYQDMVKRLGQMAKQGPRKTVWDPEKRVYKTVPVNPPNKVSESRHDQTPAAGDEFNAIKTVSDWAERLRVAKELQRDTKLMRDPEAKSAVQQRIDDLLDLGIKQGYMK